MNIQPTYHFIHQLKKIGDAGVIAQVSEVVAALIAANTPAGFPGTKKLNGYIQHYRIRIGQYRLGIFYGS